MGALFATPMLRDAATPLLSMRELKKTLVLRRLEEPSRRTGDYLVLVGLDPTTLFRRDKGPRIKSEDGVIVEGGLNA